MILLKNILIPTDFSEASTAALAYGRALAQTFGADVHLLHVMDNTFLRPIPDQPFVMKHAAYAQLNELLSDHDRRQLHARTVVEESDAPAEVIVEYARANQIDLIVMGTHGRQGAAHMLMGSVAERVVRTAPCPALTIRQSPRTFTVPDLVPASVPA